MNVVIKYEHNSSPDVSLCQITSGELKKQKNITRNEIIKIEKESYELDFRQPKNISIFLMFQNANLDIVSEWQE